MKYVERFQVGASTDFMGAAWRDPYQFSRVIPRKEFPQVRYAEVVGVGGVRRIATMMRGLRDQGVLPVQIHSYMGASPRDSLVDSLKMRAIEWFLISPFGAALYFPGMDVVVHAPAIRTLLRKSPEKVPLLRHTHVLVENHDTGPTGLTEALEQRNALRTLGIRADVLVDTHHATRYAQTSRESNKLWGALVEFVGKHSGTRDGSIYECHLPEGTSDDAMPDQLSVSKRRDLLNAAGPAIKRMTFEYQREGILSLLGMGARNEDREKRRMSRKMNSWGKAGLFDRI